MKRGPYKKKPPIVRFSTKYTIINGCWIWNRPRKDGYGMFFVDGSKKLAHRWSYTHHIGDIPSGMHVDHLCCNKACVNPKHLEVVTLAENSRRHFAKITHCPAGHEYTTENTIVETNQLGNPSRRCRSCAYARNHARRHRDLEATRAYDRARYARKKATA